MLEALIRYHRKPNKISSGWNKAAGAFDGDRGPSIAKFQTLAKRFHTAMAGHQKMDDSIADQRAALSAIVDRLNAMNSGMFSGRLKSDRNDLPAFVQEHVVGARQLADAVNGLCGEVSNELIAAEPSI